MFTYRFYACILGCCLAFAMPLATWAEDAVSPPPETTVKSPPTAHAAPVIEHPTQSSTENGDDVNLKKELVPGNIGKNVSVRAYIRKSDKAKISEYSMHGRVYMVKVKPAGAMPAYYLYDDNGDGTFNKRLPANYKHLNPPSWVVKTF